MCFRWHASCGGVFVSDVVNSTGFWPEPPKCLEDVRLPYHVLEGLILRSLFYRREMTGSELSEELGLPFYGVLEPIVEAMRDTRMVEVTRGELASISYAYAITDFGRELAVKSLEQTTYSGVAPVSLEEYVQAVKAQSFSGRVVDWETLRGAFGDLIFDESILAQIGPAINSGRSLFLYGPPGNGKSSVAERLVRVMGDAIFIPECLEVRGQFVKLFDPFNHRSLKASEDDRAGRPFDRRWRLIRRPFLVVGGELTLESLDLNWNEQARYYEAPLQLKANGGGLMIDDFGRQRVDPKSLLNRWIVPLERKVDYLTLATGAKIQIPFDELVIFSTNLDPKDLVDEAFLRRIRYKILVDSPSEENFHRIWELQCRQRGLNYEPSHVDYFLKRQIHSRGVPLRGCHARDVLDHIEDLCRFNGWQPAVTSKLIDLACEAYFVPLNGKGNSSPDGGKSQHYPQGGSGLSQPSG